MGAIDRVFRTRRPSQDRPLAAIIAGLWRNGEQGVLYDASDISTMFQDAAGTLPVYAPGGGQVDPPVGLWLDKRLGRLKGPERLTASWTTDAGISYAGSALTFAAAPSSSYATNTGTVAVGKWYEATFTVTGFSGSGGVSWAFNTVSTGNVITANGTYTQLLLAANSGPAAVRARLAATTAVVSNISLKERPGNHAYQATTTSRPTLSARYNLLTGTDSLATQSAAVVSTTYMLTTAGPGSVTLSGAASGTYTAGSRIVTCTAGTLTLTVSGSVTQADLRPANDGVGLPSYQRVVDANTYDAAGFPLYLRFDGVDDWLQTASIDFSGTDKVLLSTAMRKFSDAAAAVPIELSNFYTNVGAFALIAPVSAASATVSFVSKGATTSITVSDVSAVAPVSFVSTGYSDIGNKLARLRTNGVVKGSSTVDQGGGSYGTYPLYIGRRGGTSLPFNGRLYSLLIRGAATPDATITKVERYLNQNARIY